MDSVVEIENFQRTFAASPPVFAVRNCNLVVRAGDYIAIEGRSGSGKSTLLHLMGILDRPTYGRYWLNGVDTNSLGERQRARLRATEIGFVFQTFYLVQSRTALENVMMGEMYVGTPLRERRRNAEYLLERVGVEARAGAKPNTLSGGERQRVAIARALIGTPSLILADEPTGNLDSATSLGILDLLDDLNLEGATIAVVTHDPMVASRAKRRFEMSDGVLLPR